MPSQVHRRGSAKPEINLTPMIDITFQLIIFFLLTTNMATEQAVEMRVPLVDNSQAQELPEGNRIVINVVPRGVLDNQPRSKDNPLAIDGFAQKVKVGMDDYGMHELAKVSESLKAARQRQPNLEVELRADSALSYDQVQPVMSAILGAGISRINLTTFLPGESPE